MLRDDACALRKRFTEEIRPLPPTSEEPGAAVRRSRELHRFCRLILGWDDAQRQAVDDVIRAFLAAVAAGVAIPLRGESDLVPVARALHSRLLGPERPFVVCDPRRRDGDGSVRSAPNRRRGMDALVAATGGSVCLRARRLPADFAEMADSLRGSGPTAQVFVCLSGDDRMRVRDLLSPPVEIPSLVRLLKDSGGGRSWGAFGPVRLRAETHRDLTRRGESSNIRGDRCQVHEAIYLNDMFLPHSEVLEELWVVSAEDFVRGLSQLVEHLAHEINDLIGDAVRFRNDVLAAIKRAIPPVKSPCAWPRPSRHRQQVARPSRSPGPHPRFAMATGCIQPFR